jgi:hypothetical protein
MHIKRNDNQRLILIDFPFMVLVPILIPTAGIIYLLIAVAGDWEMKCFFLAFIIGWDAILLLFVKLSIFEFDLVERRLVWIQRGVYRKKGGTLPFDQIQGAKVDILSSGDGTSYRLALSTQQGTVPMMGSYTGHGRPTVAKALGQIAAAVNEALKTNPASEMEDEILALASAGQHLAAVQMARQRFGWDLNQANKFVEGLTERLGPSPK